MSILFSRTAIVPVWLILLGLFALFGPPMTSATSTLLFIVGGVAPAIMLVLWKEHAPTVAEVLHQVETSRTE